MARALNSLAPRLFCCPRDDLRVFGEVDYTRLVSSVARELSYNPPSFRRKVLYTPQFCKRPLPGQSLGEPRPELEELGFALGELFRSEDWTLIDIDIVEGSINPLKVYMWLLRRGLDGYLVYPTRRGVHIFVKRRLRFASHEIRIGDVRTRVEVKPCSDVMCTSFYRTLNAFRVDGSILVMNGRVAVILDSDSYRVKTIRELALTPPDKNMVEKVLGIELQDHSGSPKPSAFSKQALPILGVEVHGFASDTPARLTPKPWYTGTLLSMTVDIEELLNILKEHHTKGGLPPCLEAIVEGPGEGNRFAHLVLLVAALSLAGFSIGQGDVRRWCEVLVERWGGKLNQCVSKLKSILVCRGDSCVYCYGPRLVNELAPLWRCNKRLCPITECPGARNPWKAVRFISRYLFKLLMGYRLRGGS